MSTTPGRLHVDWTRCDGRGLCQELLPELLGADDWGYPLSRTTEPSPAVPPSLRRLAEHAVAECPRLALRLQPGTAQAADRVVTAAAEVPVVP